MRPARHTAVLRPPTTPTTRRSRTGSTASAPGHSQSRLLCHFPFRSLSPRLKVSLDLLQSLAFCLRKQEDRHEEVNHREAGEHEEDRGISVLADERQKDPRRSRRNHLVDHQRNAHAIRSNARWHQLSKLKPHTHARTKREERHE